LNNLLCASNADAETAITIIMVTRMTIITIPKSVPTSMGHGA
jgi:hypothetical protein